MTRTSREATRLVLSVPSSHVLLALTAYVAVVVAAFALRDAPAARGVTISLAFVAFTSAALYFNARRVRSEVDGRAGWLLISFAGAVAILFELTLAAEAAFPSVIAPSPALWLTQSLLSNLAMSVGILLLPYGTESVRHRTRMACDAFAFFVGAFLVFWVVGGRREVYDSAQPLLTRVEALVSYSFNALELGIVIYIGSRAMQRFRGPLGWFLLAFSALTIGSAVVAFARVRGEPSVGSAGELVQMLAFPFFVLAPLSKQPRRMAWRDEASLAGDLLTYGPVMLAMLIVLPASIASGTSDFVLVAGVPLLAFLLLFRQFLAVRDVRDLSRTLEQRVLERTEALRRSEQALAQAKRLEAVGRVAGGVAHDFNNVLHAIQLAASTMEDSPQTEPWRTELNIIRDATRTGASLAREVLDFSKPELAADEDASVADSLRALEWMRHQLGQRHIRYDVTLPSESVHVRLARTRLEQVLANLITNARDAVADGGSIRVTAERTWVDDGSAAEELGIPSGAYVRLTVADDGAGIAEEVMPQIFEPYFTTKTENAGTGLGLATCYNVVRRAGGTVTVTSTPGGGATFDVLLPTVV